MYCCGSRYIIRSCKNNRDGIIFKALVTACYCINDGQPSSGDVVCTFRDRYDLVKQ